MRKGSERTLESGLFDLLAGQCTCGLDVEPATSIDALLFIRLFAFPNSDAYYKDHSKNQCYKEKKAADLLTSRIPLARVQGALLRSLGVCRLPAVVCRVTVHRRRVVQPVNGDESKSYFRVSHMAIYTTATMERPVTRRNKKIL